ncbi:DUF6053 domain-containing protein [Lysobacter enzymogenes]
MGGASAPTLFAQVAVSHRSEGRRA